MLAVREAPPAAARPAWGEAGWYRGPTRRPVPEWGGPFVCPPQASGGGRDEQSIHGRGQHDALPRYGAAPARLLARAPHLRALHLGAAGRQAVQLLRGPAHGQRRPRRAPRPLARLQGPVPALQDDARLPRPPQGGLGHARPARGAGGGAGTGPEHQGRHRGVRHRRVQPALPGVGDALRVTVARPDGPDRVLDRHGRRLRHLPRRVRGVGLVDLQVAVGRRSDLRGPAGDAALPALRDLAVQPRAVAGLPGGHAGPQHHDQVPRAAGVAAARVARLRRRDLLRRLDDDALDAARQHGPGGRAGGDLRGRGDGRGRTVDPGAGAARWGRGGAGVAGGRADATGVGAGRDALRGPLRTRRLGRPRAALP